MAWGYSRSGGVSTSLTYITSCLLRVEGSAQNDGTVVTWDNRTDSDDASTVNLTNYACDEI